MKSLFTFAMTLSVGLNLSISVLTSTNKVYAADHLKLDEYISQVKGNNPGFKSSLLSSQGAELRSSEASLLVSPTFFANATFNSDSKLPPFSFLLYESQISRVYSFGIRQNTTFGLQASLKYDLQSINLVGARLPGGFAIPTYYNNASPVLELVQSLWGNGFGRTTRAQEQQIEAGALASAYQASFMAKSWVTQGEAAYWRLALARQAVEVQEEAVERAKKIYEWNLRRVNLQLGDKGDALQAEALLRSRELQLLNAKNEQKLASREFNSLRNLDSDQVAEKLIPLDPGLLDRLEIPKRAELRDDVRAAKEGARASQANAVIGMERNKPTLDLVASAALNGQSATTGVYPTLSESASNSFTFDRPTYAVSLRFTAPLNLGAASRTREGWGQEQTAAELNFDRKLFEQEQAWKNLLQNLAQARENLDLSTKLEQIQKNKLQNERDRLNRGRTTTYQVLLFEQDYLLAQFTRIQNQANVLSIIAQMKLFGETI